MLCSKSFELVKQLDTLASNAHELAPYNDDCVRYTFEECRALFSQNAADVQAVQAGNGASLPAVMMRHAALQRNKRCLLAYAYKRMNWVAALRFELASVVAPKHIREAMSELEVTAFFDAEDELALLEARVQTLVHILHRHY